VSLSLDEETERSKMDRDKVSPPGSQSRREFLRGAVFTGGSLLAGGALLEACGSSSSATSVVAHGAPKRGGTLTVGFTGGGPQDTIDPHKVINNPDVCRTQQLFDSLVVAAPDARPRFDLATAITPNAKATQWTIHLRPGVTFHNGKDVTADDVVFTLRRILNPKAPLPGANSFGPIDYSSIAKVDRLTVRMDMLKPFSSLIDQMASYFYFMGIVPVGYDPRKPIGTGPFMFSSFTPGQQSSFVRNPHYWQAGLPHLDKVIVTDLADDSALLNALVSGQINAAGTVTATDLAQVTGNSKITVIRSQSGLFQPFTMRVDQAPFSDVRVRQALRLVVDRPQFVASGLAGSGVVGHDVFAPFDPGYDASLHRQQDIAQAKSLLKAAGRQDLSVQLVTSPIEQGTVQMAEVFAQQASAAGVKVHLRQVDTTTFFGPNYLKWAFSQDYYFYSGYLAQVAQAMLPKSPFNETHYSNPKYSSLYDQANATLDQNLQNEIKREMQLIDFNEGSYIIPAFVTINDAFDSRLVGLGPSKIGLSLSNFELKNVAFT
jgi:peptide/nickel transport system substrate-binding protein